MKTDLLHAFLIDVRERGAAVIPKRKLLWLLSRVNESPTAWASLVKEWNAEIAPATPLHGSVWGDNVILTTGPVENIEDDWSV